MDIMTTFVMLMVMIAIESLFLVIIFWRTPVIPFLKAALMGSKIMISVSRDKIAAITAFKTKWGSAVLKKEGIYNLSEGSHILEAKTKIPMYIAFRDQASTITLDYPAILHEVKERGIKINNISDVENLINKVKNDMERGFDVKVMPFKTYPIHNLENMFPFNLDPTFVEAHVQGELSKFMKLMKSTPMAIAGIAVLFIAGAIAYMIINNAVKGQMSVADCQNMVNAAKCVVGQGGYFVNMTPMI